MPERPKRYGQKRPKNPNVHKPPSTKRPSAHKQGYGRRWQLLREVFLGEHPLCARCQERGMFVSSTVVDHIKPHRGDETLFWDVGNLEALCASCHSRKTASRDGGFGNKPKP
jgi:5-methylcytosine-specific restriction protein A